MIGGLYRPGDSLIHRMKPGAKLLALLFFAIGMLSFSSPLAAGAGLALASLAYPIGGLSWRIAFAQIRPLLIVLIVLLAVQAWLVSFEAGLLLFLRFAALILAAGLVTLTTKTGDLVETLERGLSPFARFGVDTAKVSLAISLAIRFMPVISAVFSDIREAQAARGRERSAIALAVPLIVRLLKMGDEIAEAIDARS
ncbi:MAG: energy-coupling factor transporter transmembrane protein EcfT [Fulvimarina manganoxydans]|uniref:energy-coupling factor transporter transmembrane component T family protein n=1 Tax=Fulvimarina manganoxydans TaxID=937218 RepID=UPI0023575CDB|nr:energy-coupling factor transporter transmembrane protein EcfT [Fulvimarina manganoxydans]MCK5931489.1 energy-coupling factor transporter transmembrane protein EcfT [Fulvimarina manganoxydans]